MSQIKLEYAVYAALGTALAGMMVVAVPAVFAAMKSIPVLTAALVAICFIGTPGLVSLACALPRTLPRYAGSAAPKTVVMNILARHVIVRLLAVFLVLGATFLFARIPADEMFKLGSVGTTIAICTCIFIWSIKVGMTMACQHINRLLKEIRSEIKQQGESS
jgi:hypothetical protein